MNENKPLAYRLIDDSKFDQDGGIYKIKTFIYALQEEDSSTISLLKDKGITINSQDKNGMTALQYAALEGTAYLQSLLIDKGADIQIRNNDGESVLHLAAKGGSLWLVKTLIEMGLPSSELSNKNMTAYDLAVENSNTEIMDFLKVDNSSFVQRSGLSAVVDKKIYCMLGNTVDKKKLQLVGEYEPLNDKWTRRADANKKGYDNAVVIGKDIFLIDG